MAINAVDSTPSLKAKLLFLPVYSQCTASEIGLGSLDRGIPDKKPLEKKPRDKTPRGKMLRDKRKSAANRVKTAAISAHLWKCSLISCVILGKYTSEMSESSWLHLISLTKSLCLYEAFRSYLTWRFIQYSAYTIFFQWRLMRIHDQSYRFGLWFRFGGPKTHGKCHSTFRRMLPGNVPQQTSDELSTVRGVTAFHCCIALNACSRMTGVSTKHW